MRSKLFTNSPVVSKDFSEDLGIVAGLDLEKEILDFFPRSISEYILATTAKAESEALGALREKWPLPPKEMEAILRVSQFFLRKMEVEDSLDDIMADIAILTLVDREELPRIKLLVEALLTEFKKTFAAEKLAVSTRNSGLKLIEGITHLVDLRPIVSNRIDLGDDADAYEPIVTALVPVAILRLRLTGDEDVVFQLSRRMLGILQNELKAIEKELHKSIRFVGEDKISPV